MTVYRGCHGTDAGPPPEPIRGSYKNNGMGRLAGWRSRYHHLVSFCNMAREHSFQNQNMAGKYREGIIGYKMIIILPFRNKAREHSDQNQTIW